MDGLCMDPPTESVDPALREGNHYKVNFYVHNTSYFSGLLSVLQTPQRFPG